MDKRIRKIAQVSDIHFGWGFDRRVWESITNAIVEAKPELIAATGDFVNHPWPSQLVRAREELRALARVCDCELEVLPGNHDVAFWGMFQIWVFRSLFASVFADDNDNDRALYERYNRARKDKRRWKALLWRNALALRSLRYLVRVAFNRAKLQYPKVNSNPTIFLACLNSNKHLFLASGKVDRDDLTEVKKKYRTWLEETGVPSVFAPRILLIHHHVVPIPYGTDEDLEGTLVLRNAATVANEAQKIGCDLILHGHKHLDSMSRLRYGTAESESTAMGVLAAGSAGKKYPLSGHNNWNLIKLDQVGEIEIHRYFCGSTPDDQKEEVFRLSDHENFKRRLTKRGRDLLQLCCTKITRDVQLDEFGTAATALTFEGLRVFGEQTLSRRTHTIATTSGRLIKPPRSVNTEGGTEARLFVQNRDAQSMKFDVCFEREINSKSAPITYVIRYSMFNSYVTSAWEAEETGLRSLAAVGPGSNCYEESTGLRVQFPCDELVLRLATSGRLAAIKPRVEVSRPRSPESIRLDDDKTLTVGAYDVDHEMTEREARSVTPYGGILWEARIRNPIPGFRYVLKWGVQDVRSSNVAASQLAKIQEARRRLNAYGAQRRSAKLSDGNATMLTMLREFVNTFPYRDGDESLCASLMVYDPDVKKLVMVEACQPDDHPVPWSIDFAIGEGLVGAALKQGRVLTFVRAKLDADSEDDAGVDRLWLDPQNVEGAEMANFQVALSIPFSDEGLATEWRDGERDLYAEDIIGMLSVGSMSPNSPLIDFVDDPETYEQLALEMAEIGQVLGEQLLLTQGIKR